MGYRSQVALKTTTEGYVLLKLFDDSIEKEEDKPLAHLTVEKTKSGFYKLSHPDIKWYESYSSVQNFNLGLEKLEAADIPYAFVRIGEDHDDIEHKVNWTDDMPTELETFEPITEIYDEDRDYEEIIPEDGEK